MKRLGLVLFLVILLIGFVSPVTTGAQSAVVHAVLFYSPTCPHCHKVITEDLPPLWDQYGGEVEVVYIPPVPGEEQAGPAIVGIYGDQLEILYVNTITSVGSGLFRAAIDQYQIPEDDRVVPTLLVGDLRLVGSIDIPEQFPGIIADGLQAGGIEWPPLPGLPQQLAALQPLPTQQPTSEPTPETTPAASTEPLEAPTPPIELDAPAATVLEKFKLDPLGNSLSVIVLLGMVASVLFVGYRLTTTSPAGKVAVLPWAIPVLTLVGMVIAGYLSYVEATGSDAACGPVGDCNTVQQSSFAMLFGAIPVGRLGLLGYMGLLAVWIVARAASGRLTSAAVLVLFGMATVGTLFSLYLTFLEPFVIGATCAWCLSSSVIMTAIFLLAKDPAAVAFRSLTSES